MWMAVRAKRSAWFDEANPPLSLTVLSSLSCQGDEWQPLRESVMESACIHRLGSAGADPALPLEYPGDKHARTLRATSAPLALVRFVPPPLMRRRVLSGATVPIVPRQFGASQ